MTHSLTLGSLLLTDSTPHPNHDFTFSVLAEGASFGVAQGVQEVVRSLLADGDLVRTTRHGNREVTFRVQISGPTLQSVAQGETALRREVGRKNVLTWAAPDVFAVPTVFEVVTSEMSQTFDDLDELNRRRVFVVTLTCAPFARSENLSTVAALSSGTTTVVVDTCDSATGWDGFRNGFPYAASTAWEAGSVGVAELEPAVTSPETWGLTRNGSVDFTSTPYLVIEVRTIASDLAGAQLDISATADGVRLPVLAVLRLPSSAYFRVTFDASAVDAVSALAFTHVSMAGHPWQGVFIRNVSRTSVQPGVTARQLTRVIEPGGTERTPCSLEVIPGPAETIGMALVHTSPESGLGYSPALRQYRASGNTVTESTGLVSGGRELVNSTPVVAQVPLTSLPEDGYSLVALMRSTVAGTFPVVWQVRTFFSGNYLGGFSGVAQATFSDPNLWTLVPLAVVPLPPVRASQNAFVQLNISRTPVASEVIDLDEWWAFRAGEDCALTIVQSTSSFLWLDSPDTSSPVPRVWVGINGDRSDARHPGANLLAQGNHVLHPDGTTVFVATTGISQAGIAASYYKRWHSNAAE